MSCVLRIAGRHFKVDEFLSEFGMAAISIWRVGGPKLRNGVHDQSGCNIGVSDADFADLSGQVNDAISFLKEYRHALLHATEFGLEEGKGVELDFGLETRLDDVTVQVDRFPLELVQLAGQCGCAICLSQYPHSGDNEE